MVPSSLVWYAGSWQQLVWGRGANGSVGVSGYVGCTCIFVHVYLCGWVGKWEGRWVSVNYVCMEEVDEVTNSMYTTERQHSHITTTHTLMM